mmetsp:Transcript_26302/g.36661  ORF Transcript_26302/g.36661 Transcript_26302/m.36661 type:complete len:205 (-) Transcript_26302:154-768(-)
MAPRSTERLRMNPSRTSRRVIPMYSLGFKVWPMSTTRFEGEIIFILRTLRSMISSGRSNSSTMQRGIAPPQGLTLSILRSKMKVSSSLSFANTSAAAAPDGPPPMTPIRYLDPSAFACPLRALSPATQLQWNLVRFGTFITLSLRAPLAPIEGEEPAVLMEPKLEAGCRNILCVPDDGRIPVSRVAPMFPKQTSPQTTATATPA